MAGVLCVGFAAQDYVFSVEAIPTTAEKHRARDLAVVGGGIAANAAVAVARLGGSALLSARLGADAVGDEIVRSLEREGVDCSLVYRGVGLRSPLSSVIVDAAGERLVLSYSDPGMPDATEVIPERLPQGIQAVMTDTRWEEGAAKALAVARASGGVGVLDADRAPQTPGLVERATHVAFAAQGLRELTGRSDLAAALRDLGRTARNWLAVTDGPRGVFYLKDGEVRLQPAFPVEAADTLGAGDVFHGALALALAEGRNEPEAVRFAAATAAIKCTRFGGRAGSPTRAEVDEFLRQAG